jgi:GT2 family glycosyltransferase/glycosyltransferase involved in cell wall biosynthesis
VLLPALVPALTGRGPALGPRLPRAAVRLRGVPTLPRPAPPEIDVIVPVYRGAAETLACLRSVLAAECRIAHRIVVIDDCSPEPGLSAALQALAAAGRILYLRNDSNLGFVASVNRGMALAAAADVVLLNADTVVPPGFLDRLYRAAASDPAIATVTPLSNNATVYSLPAPPGAPEDPWAMDTAGIDALCRAANPGVVRDVPTAHGFCMFIRRAALEDVGPFDAKSFGTGYGEENDFSLRALERGWRNVIAGDVYVSHRGEVSFAATAARAAQLAANLRTVQTRYPYYEAFVADFIRADPLHDLRNNVQKAVWRRHERIALFITLALEGGAARHATDMMARLTEEGWLVLALAAGRDADGAPTLHLRRAGCEEALRYPAGVPHEAVLADILDLGPRFIHVQHLLDLPDSIAAFVRESGIAYAVTLHDFFYACPKVTLLDAGWSYCGMPPAEKCTLCVRQGPIHAAIHPSLAPYAEEGPRWRARWEGLLRDAAQVIAPSRDTAARYAQLFPGLAMTVRPHFAPRDLRPPSRAGQIPATRLRVALPGALGPQKGVLPFVELARHCSRWHEDIHFVVPGYTDRAEVLESLGNVTLLGGYQEADAVAALAEAGCRVALLLNVFPETFSYTLSEAIAAGLVPVGFDFGAVGERMKALRIGIALPPGAPPEQIVAALRRAATLPPPAIAPAALYAGYRRLMEDYYAPALADLAEASPPPDQPRLLGWPAGMHPDRWCDPVVGFALWSARPLARIALSLQVPAAGYLQAVEIAANGVRLARSMLENGPLQRIACPLPQTGARLLRLTCRFDFVFRLAPPDIRSCAALFFGLRVSEGTGWLEIDLPERPERGAGSGAVRAAA